jgi:hypothetical protein
MDLWSYINRFRHLFRLTKGIDSSEAPTTRVGFQSVRAPPKQAGRGASASRVLTPPIRVIGKYGFRAISGREVTCYF